MHRWGKRGAGAGKGGEEGGHRVSLMSCCRSYGGEGSVFAASAARHWVPYPLIRTLLAFSHQLSG